MRGRRKNEESTCLNSTGNMELGSLKWWQLSRVIVPGTNRKVLLSIISRDQHLQPPIISSILRKTKIRVLFIVYYEDPFSFLFCPVYIRLLSLITQNLAGRQLCFRMAFQWLIPFIDNVLISHLAHSFTFQIKMFFIAQRI